MKTISVLVDIIIPKDTHSGSASEAGVPDFIEFMAKDQPGLQTPLRGGLVGSTPRPNAVLKKHSSTVRPLNKSKLWKISPTPERKKPGMSQGIAFFSLMRNLTASGFWTSQSRYCRPGLCGQHAESVGWRAGRGVETIWVGVGKGFVTSA
jgi:gluconate 2-dehydrogenase gamma chain